MAANFLEELRTKKTLRPFASFRIVTTKGDKFLVEDRFQFAIGQSQVIYVYPASDRVVRIGEDEIAGVESAEQKPAA